MPASRGDTKPCTVPACPGTMQYGRRRDADTRPAPTSSNTVSAGGLESAMGWNCSAAPEHFRQQ
jgi:hypothetical protein